MSVNYSTRDRLAILTGTESIPLWDPAGVPGNTAKRMTPSAIVNFVATTGLTGSSFDGNATLDSMTLTTEELTATAAITSNMTSLNHATVIIEATLASLAAGKIHIINQEDAGTAGHTVTLAIGTFDGTNNTATFDAQHETLIVVGLPSGQGAIILNSGSVTMSSV